MGESWASTSDINTSGHGETTPRMRDESSIALHQCERMLTVIRTGRVHWVRG